LIDLPVAGKFVYASEGEEPVTDTVRRVALEIGYYDENLPALVRNIIEMANKLGAQTWFTYPDWLKTYFRGLAVRNALEGFNVLNRDPEAEGRVYIEHSRQALTGEKALRVEINGVGIPYNGRVQWEVPPQYPVTSD